MALMNISELSEATGVTPRNIKRYIHERLLPPPDGKTRSARYSDSHRRDLIRIESLRAAGLSLDQIRSEFLPRFASTAPAKKLDVRVGVVLVEHRYQIAEGVFVVFTSADGPRDQRLQIEMARRCRAACQEAL
jgi:DNA-binding transcriptional MerR regulator